MRVTNYSVALQMGEPKSEASNGPPNGGAVTTHHKKPTTLNLTSGTSFYRPPRSNGVAAPAHAPSSSALNDPHLRQQLAAAGSAAEHVSILKSALAAAAAGKQLPNSWSTASWSCSDGPADYEDQRESPPPPTPASSNPSPSSVPAPATGAGGPAKSARHQLNGHARGHHNGFALYTPPTAPAPPTLNGCSGAAPPKVRCGLPNGLPQPAPRRPHSIAASSPFNLAAIQAALSGGRTAAAAAGPPVVSPVPPPTSTSTSTSSSSAAGTNGAKHTPNGISASYSWSTGLSNGGSATATGAPGPGVIGSNRQRPPDSVLGLPEQQPAAAPGVAPAATRSAVPPQSLWNGGHLSAAASGKSPAESSSSSSVSSVSSAASTAAAAAPPNPASAANINNKPAGSAATAAPAAAAARTPGEPIQWGASGLVLHQPVARRPYPTTLPHPGSPTPTPKALSCHGTASSSNTWSSRASRPHSIASTPVGGGTSPSDSGYRSLPSASSDYQLKSAALRQHPPARDPQSAARRLSLPSAQNLLRGPRPSPTFHGFPSKPYGCGLSPNSTNPMFLGCTHANGSSTPSSGGSGSTASVRTPTSPATLLSTYQAIQQLLAQQKNGFKLSDDKLNLFVDILDTQERFAQVSLLRMAESKIKYLKFKKKKTHTHLRRMEKSA